MPMGGALNKPLMLIIGLLAVVLTAAAACGGDDDPTPSRRPAGTTAPAVTTAPVATNTLAPTNTPTTAAPAATGGDATAGQAVFLGKGCGACHTVQGLAGAAGAIGPDLTQLATNAASRIAGTSAEAYIRQSIEDPPAFLVEGFGPIMPATRRSTMDDTEFENLVAFLLAQE